MPDCPLCEKPMVKTGTKRNSTLYVCPDYCIEPKELENLDLRTTGVEGDGEVKKPELSGR